MMINQNKIGQGRRKLTQSASHYDLFRIVTWTKPKDVIQGQRNILSIR